MKKMRELRPDITFVGMDISKVLIARAREQNPDTEFIAGDALEPFDLE